MAIRGGRHIAKILRNKYRKKIHSKFKGPISLESTGHEIGVLVLD